MKRILKHTFFVLFAGMVFTGSNAMALTSIQMETDVEMVALKVANETVQGGYKLIKIADVKAMLDAKEDFVLIDAHPKWEFEMGHIDGAQWFGFQSNMTGVWEKDVTDGAPTQDDYRKVLGPDLNKKIVIYCGFTKCGRSHNASTWAKKTRLHQCLSCSGRHHSLERHGLSLQGRAQR